MHLIVFIVLLYFSSLILASVFSRSRLPRIGTDILAGLILGPSILGHYHPTLFQSVASLLDNQNEALNALQKMGVICIMLSAGLMIKVGIDRKSLRTIIILASGALFLPFGAGFFISSWFENTLGADVMVFAIVISAVTSATSVPVLSQIFIDSKLVGSSFARNVLLAASIQDVIIWCFISIALVAHSNEHWTTPPLFDIGQITLTHVAFLLGGYIVYRALKLGSSSAFFERIVYPRLPEYLIVFVLIFILFSGKLGIPLFIIALVVGIIIANLGGDIATSARQIVGNISFFFVPLYFVIVGYKVDLQSLDYQSFLLFFTLSSALKIVGILIMARSLGFTWFKATDYAMTMNARGGPGIMISMLAYSAEIIDNRLFVTLLGTSILTSIVAGMYVNYRRQAISESH